MFEVRVSMVEVCDRREIDRQTDRAVGRCTQTSVLIMPALHRVCIGEWFGRMNYSH